ncbi:hypothetical protein ACWEP4_42605 [Streptomyces sp. NPDC004227]
MPDSPQDPITNLAAGAAQLHELYSAYVDAGFTPDQAMQIVLTIISSGARGGQ